jgi:hypothetical protein
MLPMLLAIVRISNIIIISPLNRRLGQVMKLRIASASIGVALAATACNGSSIAHTTPPNGISTPGVSTLTPTSTPPSPVPVGPKGILAWTGTGYASTGTAITGYDPVTNQQSRLSIPSPPQAGSVGTANCPYGQDTVSVRQSFSPNFDKATWCSGSSPEGSASSIGYVDIPSGVVHNLTPEKGSGYGAQSPQQVLPIFNPKTGDLWFYDVNLKSFMSFDLGNPGQGSQKRSNPVQATGLSFGMSTIPSQDPTKVLLGGKLFFSADGSTLVTTNGNIAISTDGKSALSDITDLQRLDGASNVDLKWESGKELSGCGPYPGAVFIDSSSFLCSGYSSSLASVPGSHGSLYRVTINGSILTPLQLLPDSENVVQNSIAYPGLTPGFAVSPDKQTVAFVARVPGEGDVLFTVPLKGGEPTRIGSFTGTMLVDWK